MDISGVIEWFKNWTKLKISIHVSEKVFLFPRKRNLVGLFRC